MVISRNFSYEHLICTTLPVDAMNEELARKGHNCVVSHTAGEYICNYIFYLSLMEGSSRGIPSLFIHVPTFAVEDFQKQVNFLVDLCLAIKKFLAPKSIPMKLYAPFGNPKANLLITTAKFCNLHLELPHFTTGTANEKDFVALSPLRKFPLLEIAEGSLFETTAIMRYFARISKSPLYGNDILEQTMIDQ